MVALYGTRGASDTFSVKTGLLGQLLLLGLLAAILAIALLWEKASLSSLGLHFPTISTFAWAMALTALFVFGLGPFILRAPRWLNQTGFEKPLAQLRVLPPWYLTIAVVVGGAVEEVLYRGFAIEHLARVTGSVWSAACIAIAAFGLAHVPLWGWIPAFTMAFSGAVLTIAYLWHRDLAANILAHIATDFVGIVLPAIAAGGQRNPAR